MTIDSLSFRIRVDAVYSPSLFNSSLQRRLDAGSDADAQSETAVVMVVQNTVRVVRGESRSGSMRWLLLSLMLLFAIAAPTLKCGNNGYKYESRQPGNIRK